MSINQKFKNFLKKILGRKIPYAVQIYMYITKKNKKLDIKNKNIWLISSTSHSNIGDLAITESELEFLKYYYNDYNIIDINDKEFYNVFKKISKLLKKDDIVFIHGGGNIGNEYFLLEWQRLEIIKRIKNNKIIIFPQTIFVSNEYNCIIDKDEYMEMANQYYEQKNVYIFVREKFSYDFIKSNFINAKVFLVPDIVLRIKYSVKNKRENIIFCFRNDFEKIISNKFIQNIKNNFFKNYKIDETDMIYNGVKDVVKFRKEIVFNKMNQFSKYRLCVTDRLHCMIFCAITGTPCIAFNNHSKKVEGVYQWIKNLPYIRVVNTTDEFEKALNSIDLENKHFEYNLENLEPFYKIIFDKSMENDH